MLSLLLLLLLVVLMLLLLLMLLMVVLVLLLMLLMYKRVGFLPQTRSFVRSCGTGRETLSYREIDSIWAMRARAVLENGPASVEVRRTCTVGTCATRPRRHRATRVNCIIVVVVP